MTDLKLQKTIPELELIIDGVPWDVKIVYESGSYVPINAWCPDPDNKTLYIGQLAARDIASIKNSCWQAYHKNP